MLHPLLSRRLRRNDRNLWYHRLAYPIFSDTMFASTVSRRGNKCAQVYDSAFPIASRSEAHETLSLLFVIGGVPPTCICNNARELVQEKFHQKLKEAACHLKQLEPYTPWSNVSEREIKKLKKGGVHKMLQSRAQKCLWDDCLELEAY